MTQGATHCQLKQLFFHFVSFSDLTGRFSGRSIATCANQSRLDAIIIVLYGGDMRTVGSWGRARPSVVRGLLLLTLLFTAPAVLPASDSASRQANANIGNSLFTLTVRNGRLSLVARQASLQAVLQEIGRRMAIDVESEIPVREIISTDFNQLTLNEALQALFNDVPNYGYVIVQDKHSGRITKILASTKENTAFSGPEPKAPSPSAENSKEQPQPFTFDIDPSQTDNSK
jgi:hypothetical protein